MAEPPQSGVPAIVFDLDGTLVDTAPDLLAALNAVLAKADDLLEKVLAGLTAQQH